MRGTSSVIIAIFLFSGSAFAQAPKYSNEFLNIGVGARGLAMSKAQVASVNDVTSAYWNPAGLTGIQDNLQVSTQHAEYFAALPNTTMLALQRALTKPAPLASPWCDLG